MAALTGTASGVASIDGTSALLLVLSGLATGASWLCYFVALSRGDVSRVAPIDKLSTVLAIILALVLLGEPVSVWGAAGIVAITAGTLLMVGPTSGATRGRELADVRACVRSVRRADVDPREGRHFWG